MRKTTNKLVPNDVMESGEIVVSCRKSTPFGRGNPKATVILLNTQTGKQRIASWNWWGTVFLKDTQENCN
jgi:hypothetical protein